MYHECIMTVYENFLTSCLFWDFSSQKLFEISDVFILILSDFVSLAHKMRHFQFRLLFL